MDTDAIMCIVLHSNNEFNAVRWYLNDGVGVI